MYTAVHYSLCEINASLKWSNANHKKCRKYTWGYGAFASDPRYFIFFDLVLKQLYLWKVLTYTLASISNRANLDFIKFYVSDPPDVSASSFMTCCSVYDEDCHRQIYITGMPLTSIELPRTRNQGCDLKVEKFKQRLYGNVISFGDQFSFTNIRWAICQASLNLVTPCKWKQKVLSPYYRHTKPWYRVSPVPWQP